MNAPYVDALLAQIESADSQSDRAERLAELACYWARSGEFGKAEAIAGDLRANFGSGSYARISMLIMCIEGLLLFFRDLSPRALERVTGANVLSVAMRQADITALTASWVAHIAFNRNDFDRFCSAARQCIGALGSNDLSARGRLAIVLSDAFLVAQDWASSKHWHEVARDCAVRMGDHTTMAALTYNRAVLNLHTLRIKALQAPLEPKELRLALLELQSAINYHSIAELKSLDYFLDIARSGAFMLQYKYAEAVSLIDSIIVANGGSLSESQRALLISDRARCVSELTAPNSTSEIEFDEPTEEGLKGCDAGDRALIFSTASLLSGRSGNEQSANRYRALTQLALSQHRDATVKLQTQLSEFAATANP
jgi:hypothetical protein